MPCRFHPLEQAVLFGLGQSSQMGDLSSQVVVVPPIQAEVRLMLLALGFVRRYLGSWRAAVPCCQNLACLGEVSTRHLPVLV
jgi:hypothetical protein